MEGDVFLNVLVLLCRTFSKPHFIYDDGKAIGHLLHPNGGCIVSPVALKLRFFFFFVFFLLYACAGEQRDKRWERCQQIVALDKKVGVHDHILSM